MTIYAGQSRRMRDMKTYYPHAKNNHSNDKMEGISLTFFGEVMGKLRLSNK
jgi:hypothetical protein